MCYSEFMACDGDYNNHWLTLTNIFRNHIYINLCKCPLTQPISLLNYMDQVIGLSFLKWSFKALFNGSLTRRSFINVRLWLMEWLWIERSGVCSKFGQLSVNARHKQFREISKKNLSVMNVFFLFFFLSHNTVKKTVLILMGFSLNVKRKANVKIAVSVQGDD